ncbi:hypothetical protein DFH08DRAFT_826274 [Mycena albidolilacea]|uniref:Uncharacterized protein n=1 Tax=Mycena albidolilacea TaxID=1033008 RepID=A0AAD6Z0K6_9AGAR|nr:hypothetical protein DFH08DRAFT_826274 [Mycena albidolilacea]
MHTLISIHFQGWHNAAAAIFQGGGGGGRKALDPCKSKTYEQESQEWQHQGVWGAFPTASWPTESWVELLGISQFGTRERENGGGEHIVTTSHVDHRDRESGAALKRDLQLWVRPTINVQRNSNDFPSIDCDQRVRAVIVVSESLEKRGKRTGMIAAACKLNVPLWGRGSDEVEPNLALTAGPVQYVLLTCSNLRRNKNTTRETPPNSLHTGRASLVHGRYRYPGYSLPNTAACVPSWIVSHLRPALLVLEEDEEVACATLENESESPGRKVFIRRTPPRRDSQAVWRQPASDHESAMRYKEEAWHFHILDSVSRSRIREALFGENGIGVGSSDDWRYSKLAK